MKSEKEGKEATWQMGKKEEEWNAKNSPEFGEQNKLVKTEEGYRESCWIQSRRWRRDQRNVLGDTVLWPMMKDEGPRTWRNNNKNKYPHKSQWTSVSGRRHKHGRERIFGPWIFWRKCSIFPPKWKARAGP